MVGIFLLTKEQLRQAMLAKRRSLSAIQREQASHQIFQSAIKISQIRQALIVGLYWPHGGEVDVLPLWHHLMAQNKRVCFPRAARNSQEIEFALVRNESELHAGAYGIFEPKPEMPGVIKGDIDLVVIPGLAFDKKGYRLGWGKGYFDKWLKDYTGFRLGVAYEFQVIDELLHEAHDEKVQVILTEQRFFSSL